MKSSETVLEPRLAWVLWQGLQKLSDLLWDRYEEDFLELTDGVGDSTLRLYEKGETRLRTRRKI